MVAAGAAIYLSWRTANGGAATCGSNSASHAPSIICFMTGGGYMKTVGFFIGTVAFFAVVGLSLLAVADVLFSESDKDVYETKTPTHKG